MKKLVLVLIVLGACGAQRVKIDPVAIDRVKIDPVSVQPIHVTVDVNVRDQPAPAAKP